MLLLLIFALFGVCCATPVTTPCSENEILKPITDFNRMVDEMHSPLVNKEKKLEEIYNLGDEIEEHYDTVNRTCGDEKIDGLNKLATFLMDISGVRLLEMSIYVLADDIDTIKEKFENFATKQIRHFLINQFYNAAEDFDIVIKAIKLMKNDTIIISEMHEGIILLLNDTNIHFGKEVVPLIKELITNTNEEETLSYAKSNLQNLVERSLHNYSDALVLLNEIDSNLADQTVQEVIQNSFTNSVDSKVFDFVNNAPTVHLKTIALKSLNEKIVSLKLQNSFVSTKVYVLSKSIIRDGNINNEEDVKLLNNIVDNTTKFSKNLVYGYSCHSLKDVKSNEVEEQQAEYILQQLVEHLDENGSVLKREEEGTLLKIDLATEDHADNIKYSLLLEADDYSDSINLPVISKQRCSFVSLTNEEICGLNPQPEYNICIPTLKYLFYTRREADSVRKQSHKVLKNHKNTCNTI